MKNNLVGKRFGRLTVLEDSGKRNHRREIIWKCICDCGQIRNLRKWKLISGKIKSCGCFKRENMSRRMLKHGYTKSRLYRIWSQMKSRCLNQNNYVYKYYGRRGVLICPKWSKSFIAFKIWAMSHGYQDNLTIDRINNNGNYEPSNCQWLTISENIKKAFKDKIF